MNLLITGGASGLGKAITRKACTTGTHQVYFTYRNSVESAAALEAEFPNANGVPCDFRKSQDICALAAKLLEWNIDGLVNNAFAGRIHDDWFQKTDWRVFEKGFSENLLPVIRLTQAAITVFRRKRFGKIVTILTAGLVNRPPRGWSEYVAAKAYLASLAKSWAAENAPFNITSNCISPSFMQTGLTGDTDERMIEEMVRAHPCRKLLTTQETADAVIFLLHTTQQINGVNLVMNSAVNMI